MSKLSTILFGLIILAMLAFICVIKLSPAIEDDLVDRTLDVFRAEQQDFVMVAVEGREIILSGVAPDEVSRERAAELAYGVYGVRSVDNQITLAELIVTAEPVATATTKPQEISKISEEPQNTDTTSSKASRVKHQGSTAKIVNKVVANATDVGNTSRSYQTRLVFKEGRLLLSGMVADEASRQWLLEKAIPLFGKENIKDTLEEMSGAPAGWHATTESALLALSSLEHGQVNLLGNEYEFSGEAKQEALIGQLTKQFTKGLGGDYQGEIKLTLKATEKPTSALAKKPATRTKKNTGKICQQQFDQQLRDEQILFGFDQSEIKLESYPLLARLIKVAKACPDITIEVGGHTDDRGAEKYNQRLSEARAKSVVNYMQKHGVSAKRLSAVGYGELHPLSKDTSREGLAKNRRIELKVKEG